MRRFKRGDVIGMFKLVEFLGEGTTAQVWSATRKDGIEKALKIFHHDASEDNALLKEEYYNTVSLKNDHIITPEDYVEVDGLHIITMERCDLSLWQELNNRQQKDPESEQYFSELELAQILNDVAKALVYLHFDEKVIHHDIKPGNILLKTKGDSTHYYLTDFGITKRIKATVSMTEAQTLGLTFAYAAPERFQTPPKDHLNSDIFSLGASIYELTNGMGDVPLAQVLNNNFEIEEVKGSYSKRFGQLISSMLAKNPKTRLDANILLSLTSNYLDGEGWSEIIPLTQKDNATSCKSCGYILADGIVDCPNCVSVVNCEKCSAAYDKALGTCPNCEETKLCEKCNGEMHSLTGKCEACDVSYQCDKCGQDLVSEQATCTNCATEYNCPTCGNLLESEYSVCLKCEQPESKSGLLRWALMGIGIGFICVFLAFYLKGTGDREFDRVGLFNNQGFTCAEKDGFSGVLDIDLKQVTEFNFERCVCLKNEISLYKNSTKLNFEPTKN